MIEARRRRMDFFSPALFGEPAWDMLLALYSAPESLQLGIGDLTDFSSVSPSIARRWLRCLEAQRLVVLEECFGHQAKPKCMLTGQADDLLRSYLLTTRILI
jgi:DNA-binding MarR family transcriptional regulator